RMPVRRSMRSQASAVLRQFLEGLGLRWRRVRAVPAPPKKISGRKRHILVDTLGLGWAVAVLPANVQDFDVAGEGFVGAGGGRPPVGKGGGEGMCRAFASWVSANCSWVLQVVTRRPGAVGFEVQPMRWIVERTFGWFGRYRRLSKDYETYPRNGETWILVAMI